MSHLPDSTDFSVSWQYPPTASAPPTPVVVNTVPAYFGGRPTPPPTPPRVRVTPTVDDYAPCPPTPRCVPSSVDEDELEWSDALNSETSQSPSSGYWSTSDLDHSTCFEDPLTVLASNDTDDQDQYEVIPHVSDCLLYDREEYAYPSPILTMIERAELDLDGLKTQPVNPWACGEPFKLFSLTAGNTPATGLEMHDEQSFDYYVTHYSASSLSDPEQALSCYFSIGTIQAFQHELRMRWRWVYPEPIPPIIIRSHDLIGPYILNRRGDGYGFVVPTEDSIWSTICQRGIDSTFRPISPSATVKTSICHMGAALYYPQHIVASRFAVNVFLEVPDSAGPAPTPRCEYMGAYVLQVVDGLTLDRAIWADIDPEVQQSVLDRVPHLFKGTKDPWPRLPYVQFCYYKWDQCMVGLADEFRNCDILAASQVTVQDEEESESVYSDGYSRYSDSSSDTDHDGSVDPDTASTPSVYSDPEPEEYMSFLDFSPCE